MKGASIGGERLEGANQEKIVRYFLQLVERIERGHAAPVPQLQQLQKSLRSILRVYHVQVMIREQKPAAAWSERASLFAEWMHYEIAHMQEGDVFTIPGGWSGRESPGHAMVYEIRKGAGDKYALFIHNTGAGLSFHPYIEDGQKTKHAQVLPVTNLRLEEIVSPAA